MAVNGVVCGALSYIELKQYIITSSHHMVKTDAGLNGLYIREITI